MPSRRQDPGDTALVTSAITRARLCVDCIVSKTGVTRARVEVILTVVGETLVVGRVTATCDACGLTKEVCRLT